MGLAVSCCVNKHGTMKTKMGGEMEFLFFKNNDDRITVIALGDIKLMESKYQ
jgi:hypothetical protein